MLRSTRVVLMHAVRPASVYIEDGGIRSIGAYDAVPDQADSVHDAGDLVVSPGLVDVHVHVNEPGRTEWEGFDTATRAAAAGGVTTIVDMPLNSIPATTTVRALDAKRDAARGKCHVDVAFWGGVVPGNASHVDALVDAGVRGFKCFLVPSGVEEFPPVGEDDLRDAMPILAARGVPLLVHAESPEIIEGRQRSSEHSRRKDTTSPLGPSVYQTYLAMRPPEAEVEAIRLMIRLARESEGRVHIVHVASAEAADEISRAQQEGIQVTAETCPHYLSFAAEDIPDGATEFKCAPPIREARHREALWSALERGVLGLVATDHSPAPPALKCRGDFVRAWGGIGSLELSLSAAWTGLASRVAALGLSARDPDPVSPFVRLARWMSTTPAALARLSRKGRIEAGCDADFVIWDPDQARTVDAAALQQRHKLTPYAGRCLRGVVHATFLRGQQIWNAGKLTRAASGRLL